MAIGEYDIAKMADELGVHGLNNWMAFDQLNPFGQNVEDMRIQALRAEVSYQADATKFAMRQLWAKSAGPPPKPRPPSDFQIFKRHGVKENTDKTDFRNMTQEEIAKAMRTSTAKW